MVHSSRESFDMLLQLENNYSQAVADLISAKNRAVELLQQRQAHDLDTYSEGKQKVVPGSMISRQFEETQMLEAKWQSELQALKATQRHDYRDFIGMDYQAKLDEAKKSSLPQPLALPSVTKSGGMKPDHGASLGQEIMQPRSPSRATAGGPRDSPIEETSASASSSRSLLDDPIEVVTMPLSPTSAPPQAAFLESVNPEFVAKLKELTDMGFDERTSECALNLANWSVVRRSAFPLFISLPN